MRSAAKTPAMIFAPGQAFVLVSLSEMRLEPQSSPSLECHDLVDSDHALALAKRQEEALAELYDRYGRLAFVTALRIVHDSGRAEDVVQDSFLSLWNNANQFAARRGSLRTWLLTVVRHRAIDSLRGRAAHDRDECELGPNLEASGTTTDPWNNISGSVERNVIRKALDALPLEQRLAVELAYFGSYTQPEIADMMGVPLGTVKGRTRLGLKKLGSHLDRRDPNGRSKSEPHPLPATT